MKPFTCAELMSRRREIAWRLRWDHPRFAEALAALDREIAERGVEPIGEVARTVQTMTGGLLNVLDGGKRAPRHVVALRPWRGPDDGGRAA
jgi:hypothetical protein